MTPTKVFCSCYSGGLALTLTFPQVYVLGGGGTASHERKNKHLSPDPCWRENSALLLYTFPSYVQTHSTARRGLADWVLRLAELWRLHYVYHMCEFVPSHRSGCKPRLVCWLCPPHPPLEQTRLEHEARKTLKTLRRWVQVLWVRLQRVFVTVLELIVWFTPL